MFLRHTRERTALCFSFHDYFEIVTYARVRGIFNLSMKYKTAKILTGMAIGLLFLLALTVNAVVLVKYGGIPISELPTWVAWLLFDR